MISEKPFADITSNAPWVQSTLCAAESNKNNLEQMFLTNVVLAGSQFQAEWNSLLIEWRLGLVVTLKELGYDTIRNKKNGCK